MPSTVEDPVLLAIVQKQLDHVSKQMGWVMTRTARSPIFSQAHDFSCFVGNARGETVAQADGLPIHSGGGGFAMRAVLRDFGTRMVDGDVYLSSDPYVAGGNHLPDWTIIRPVFTGDQLVSFVCNRAHQSDIGGGAPGTYNTAATEIFHEGIRLPVLRLVKAGELQDDLWRLLLLNTRCPELMEGDLSAMMGSTKIGATRVTELINQLGMEHAVRLFDGVLDHGERRMRAAIEALPDGNWEGSDVSDTDCFEEVDVRTHVTLTIEGGDMTFDFTGSSPQIKGFKNSSIANTYSAVYVAVSSFLDVSIPRNEGAYRPIRIIAPEGTVVNALPPAPMTMNTIHPASDIINACWKALARAQNDRACAGWGKIAYSISSGQDAAGRVFVLYHWHGASGSGAVKGRDGFHALGYCATLGGLTLPNAETYEKLYPMRIIRQEIRCDGGGAGEFRGGAGVDYEVELKVPTYHSVRAEGAGLSTGYGVVGGLAGGVGNIKVFDGKGASIPTPKYCSQQLDPVRIWVSSPGGGGWGSAAVRDPKAVLLDVRNGVVSREAAEDVYRVALSQDGRSIDWDSTLSLRAGFSD